MRIVIFTHSLLSDWNHENAHFLRGVATELLSRGHDLRIYEPRDAWSLANLLADAGPRAVRQFHVAYPALDSVRYDPASLDLDDALAGANLVIAHEWNTPELIAAIGAHRGANDGRYRLFFHDTHHRTVTDPRAMARYDLRHYDGVLASGNGIRDIYRTDFRKAAWTWHEAADVRVFRPIAGADTEGDLVWIGNWGDNEPDAALREFLLDPVAKLGLEAQVYGARYPDAARHALGDAGIAYGGWLPDFEVPEVFARFRVTVHVPRRPYAHALPGIPTIRPFEAMACGIPLVSAPWRDIDALFRAGEDYLVARNGGEMCQFLRMLLDDTALARRLADHARKTILARHTCAHRVDELMDICRELRMDVDDPGRTDAPVTHASAEPEGDDARDRRRTVR